jgi:hypothetical protein
MTYSQIFRCAGGRAPRIGGPWRGRRGLALATCGRRLEYHIYICSLARTSQCSVDVIDSAGVLASYLLSCAMATWQDTVR